MATERIIRHKGPGAVASLKVKAHVDPGGPEAYITAPRGILTGSMRVDKATLSGMVAHPAVLREFISICEGRMERYIAFL